MLVKRLPRDPDWTDNHSMCILFLFYCFHALLFHRLASYRLGGGRYKRARTMKRVRFGRGYTAYTVAMRCDAMRVLEWQAQTTRMRHCRPHMPAQLNAYGFMSS